MITVRRRYEELVADFRWQIPDEFNFGALIDAWATDRSRVALYWEDENGRRERHTFWDLKQATNRFMNALGALGLARGEPLLVMLPRVPASRHLPSMRANAALPLVVGGRGEGRLVDQSDAPPTTGAFRAGDLLLNNAPRVLGNAGSRYTILGWRRLTTSTSHALNTDWVELRCPTGT